VVMLNCRVANLSEKLPELHQSYSISNPTDNSNRSWHLFLIRLAGLSQI
jgi:hypothetical protein